MCRILLLEILYASQFYYHFFYLFIFNLFLTAVVGGGYKAGQRALLSLYFIGDFSEVFDKYLKLEGGKKNSFQEILDE